MLVTFGEKVGTANFALSFPRSISTRNDEADLTYARSCSNNKSSIAPFSVLSQARVLRFSGCRLGVLGGARLVEYVRKISSLTTFLYETDPSSDSIARFLVLDTFSAFEPTALLLGLLQSDGSFKVVGHFGLNEAIGKEVLAIAERPINPFSQALQKDKVLSFGGEEKLFSKPFDQKEVEGDISGLEYSLAWPIYYLGAGIIFFKEENTLDSLDQLFFRAIGGMLAIHHTYTTTLSDFTEGVGPAGPAGPQGETGVAGEKGETGLPGVDGLSAADELRVSMKDRKELTSRQKIILEELRRGKTNATIAQNLNFSSSLIRQETMEIYRKMGISGRKELLEIDS